jgi:hypothetical protein
LKPFTAWQLGRTERISVADILLSERASECGNIFKVKIIQGYAMGRENAALPDE